jgi:phosphatidylserine decarboxylase
MVSDTFILSKRGWLPIAVMATLFLFFVMSGLHFFQFISGALLIALLVLFRNPERTGASGEPNVILSNVDGVVLGIEEIAVNEVLMKKVTILSGFWNVSMLRAPFDGSIEKIAIRHGVMLPLHNPLAQTLNEKSVLSFRTVSGDEIYVEHISQRSCFSTHIGMNDGEKMREGSRYGFLAKGRTALYLPSHTRLVVTAGNDVRAGESIIGSFEAL